MLAIYLNKQYFDSVLFNDNTDEYSLVHFIDNIIANNDIKDHKRPRLNILLREEEIDNEINNQESSISKYRHNVNNTSKKIWLDYSMDMDSINAINEPKTIKEKINQHPYSIFILNISKDDAVKLRNETNHLIISNDEIFKDFYLNRYIKKSLSVGEKYQNGYLNIFKELNDFPLFNNTVFISDPFLFNNEKSKYAPLNYKELFDMLMPKVIKKSKCCNGVINNDICTICDDPCETLSEHKLKIEYQILIISWIDEMSDNQVNNFINELKQLKDLRDYEINIEFILYKDRGKMHHRGLISNYHCITFSDNKSLAIYDIDYKAKSAPNLIRLYSYIKYLSIKDMDYENDCDYEEWKFIFDFLNEGHKLYEEAKKSIKNGNRNFLISDDNQSGNKDILNRFKFSFNK